LIHEWSGQADATTEHLEEIEISTKDRQLQYSLCPAYVQEAAEAGTLAAENTSRQFLKYLLATFSPDMKQILIDTWEAQGNLVPDKVHLLLEELCYTAPPLSST
jgi:hypothetical protein